MKKQEVRVSQKAMRMLSMGLLMGLGSVPVYALYSNSIDQFFVVLSIGCLLCGGATLVGGMLGFLFGIPRTLQQEDDNTPAPTALPAQAQPHPVAYRANTNLEQISDWLTKILVGVSLTQIDAIRQGFHDLTLQVADGLGHTAHGQVFAGSLIGFSAVLGFLFGYLWTRLHLAGAMRIADEAAIGDLDKRVQQVSARTETTSREVEDLKQQAQRDATALSLIYLQLSPKMRPIARDKLDQVIDLASDAIRMQAFNQAWQVRLEKWRGRKEEMERTIPIFRALIRNDPKEHMFHGQLGFALKDKVEPEFREAETELSTAIELRGDWRKTEEWLYYEFARAICRIMCDPGYQSGRPSAPDVRTAISADLKAAMHHENIRYNLNEIEELSKKTCASQAESDAADAAGVSIIKWLQLNHLNKNELLTED